MFPLRIRFTLFVLSVSSHLLWGSSNFFDTPIRQVAISVKFSAGGTNDDPATRYPATLAIDGKFLAEGSFRYVAARTRRTDRPSFALTLPDTSEVRRELGGTEFTLESAEFWPLDAFATYKFGEKAGLPVPRVGHISLTFNERGVGVYTVTDRGPKNQFVLSSTMLLSEVGDLPDLKQVCGNPAVSNFLNEIIQTCFNTNLPVRAERLDRLLDHSEFFRLLAFEAVVGDVLGYGERGDAGFLGVDPVKKEVRVFPIIHLPAFPVIYRPVMTAKRSLIARALMEIPSNSTQYTLAVTELVTNVSLETGLLQDIEERALRLRSYFSEPSTAQILERSRVTLSKQISARFARVRQQLKSMPDVSATGSSVSFMTLSSGKRGRGLPVKNSTDYGEQLATLVRTNLPFRPSRPISFTTIALTAPAGAIEGLAWNSTNWLDVAMAAEDRSFTNVGLRLKGHGTRHGFDKKPSFTLKFNREREGQHFHGSTKIHLQNAAYDPSYLNQFIAAWICERAKVPAARVEFAEVTVNGKPRGIFVVSEGITKGFLKREFGSSTGLLFEGEAADLNGRLDLDSGLIPSGYSWPQKAYAAAEKAIAEEDLSKLEPLVDLDAFAKFCATEVMLGHHDGYTFYASNYRIYQKTPESRLVFIPHGMDVLTLQAEGVLPVGKGVIGRALITNPKGAIKVMDALDQILDHDLDLNALVIDVAAVIQKIQPSLKKMDPAAARLQIETAIDSVRLLGDRQAYLSKELRLQREYGPHVANRK